MLYDINGINENTDNKNVIPMVIETSARGERALEVSVAVSSRSVSNRTRSRRF